MLRAGWPSFFIASFYVLYFGFLQELRTHNCETVNLDEDMVEAPEFQGHEHLMTESRRYKDSLIKIRETLQVRQEIQEAKANQRLEKFLTVLHECNLSFEKLQFNGFRAGGDMRQQFVDIINVKLVKQCLDDPDLMSECQVIKDGNALNQMQP